MITYGFWLYEELLPRLQLGIGRDLIETPNHGVFHVTVSSKRFETFKNNRRCVGRNCTLKGDLWLLQSHRELGVRQGEQRPHFNLYALTKKDELVLMTQDHIYPKSLGGSGELSNLQTMCAPCNQRKGATVTNGSIFEDSSRVDERRLREQRLRTLSAYADFLANSERLSA